MALTAPKPLRVVLGLDQARTSGWALAMERGRVVHHGIARKARQRTEVIQLALSMVGNDPRRVFVMFEQHDHMPVDRLGRNDFTTKRTSDRFVERGPKQLHGMGKQYGRWEEQLELFGVPESMRDEVQPIVWRRAIHGVTSGPDVKAAAVRWALNELREPLQTDDEAEAICIATFAALSGIAKLDGERLHDRSVARAKKQAASQGALAFDPQLLERMTKGAKP